jgi:small subunit ribosomal protein S3Ae
MAEIQQQGSATKAQKASAARKTVDKWKKKKWFTIVSSKIFDKRPLCETPGEKPKNIMGRVMRTTLDLVTGQRTKRDYSILFKVNDIQGQTASTVISGFEVNKGTLGRTIRRRNSKVALVKTVPLVGGEAMTTVVVVTERKATNAQKAGIRRIISEQLATLTGKDPEIAFQELLLGNFSNDLFKKALEICPIKKIIPAKSTFIEKK